MNISNSSQSTKLLRDYFNECPPCPGENEILVVGHVMRDGKGDWFAMKNLYKRICKAFPDRHVQVLATSASNHQDKLDLKGLKNYEIVYEPETFNKEYVEKKIDASAMIFSGPIGNLYTHQSASQNYHTKSCALHEYDVKTNFDTCAYKEMSGLGEKSLGIFVSSNKKEYKWSDIENTTLKGYLFNSEILSEEEISTYQTERDFYLCYVTSEQSAVEFIFNTAFFSESKNPNKSVDICYPSKKQTDDLKSLAKRGYFNTLTDLGYSGIKWVSWENNQIQEEWYPFGQDEGKILRIIDPGVLAARDFKVLTFLSKLTGCTGDNSIAQVLSFGNVPLYDVVKHKQGFYDALLNIVEKHFGYDTPLYKYLSSDYKMSEVRYDCLEDPLLQEQAIKLGSIIREHHSITPAIKGIANEILYRNASPEFSLTLDTLQSTFASGDITEHEFKNQLDVAMRTHFP